MPEEDKNEISMDLCMMIYEIFRYVLHRRFGRAGFWKRFLVNAYVSFEIE